jgi:Rap1a immunity proteins
MCKSADKVLTLSVMCDSYLDGYIDAAHQYGKGKVAFCLQDDDRKKAPGALVEWIGAHPESLDRPAAEVLQKALAERFPCKGRK